MSLDNDESIEMPTGSKKTPSQLKLQSQLAKAFFLESLSNNTDDESDSDEIDNQMEARKAFESLSQSSSAAKRQYAVYLWYGWGGPANKDESLILMKQAASEGDPMAAFYLQEHSRTNGEFLGVAQS